MNPPNPWSAEDVRWMRRALKLAASGYTPPNPQVGCVLVKDGILIAEGFHRLAGGPHAEAAALASISGGPLSPKGCTAYVTLEPCSHHGRTPPCADALIEAGVARVVCALVDPNPKVSGQGIARLCAAGIQVDSGLLSEEAAYQNRAFLHFHTSGLPWVTLKAAATLDGKIATRTGDSRWITGGAARREAHRMRARHSAVLVGVGTVVTDDPLLTARFRSCPRQPIRVVLDPNLRMPLGAQLLSTVEVSPVWVVHGSGAERHSKETLSKLGVRLIQAEVTMEGSLDLRKLMSTLAAEEVTSILVEGGAGTHAQFLSQGCADGAAWFLAPKLLCGQQSLGAVAGESPARIAEAHGLVFDRVRRFGADLLIEGRFTR